MSLESPDPFLLVVTARKTSMRKFLNTLRKELGIPKLPKASADTILLAIRPLLEQNFRVALVPMSDMLVFTMARIPGRDMTFEQLNSLFTRLPKGKYGLCIYGIDDLAKPDDLWCVHGCHSGQAPLDDYPNVSFVYLENELEDYVLEANLSGPLANIDNLADMAFCVATRLWSEKLPRMYC